MPLQLRPSLQEKNFDIHCRLDKLESLIKDQLQKTPSSRRSRHGSPMDSLQMTEGGRTNAIEIG